MPKKSHNTTDWVVGELRLAGLDNRMIGLLGAIAQSGSINQAAKQMGLSYKGAWQIIERANNCAPKTLVSTSTGGTQGGGTNLTEAGRALLNLFIRLERQHDEFISQLNQNLADDSDILILMQRQIIKTSACNQLFGNVTRIILGAVNAEVTVTLNGGTQIIITISLCLVRELGIKYGADAVVLVNSVDITLALDIQSNQISARNQLAGTIIRIQVEGTNVSVIILLEEGGILTALVTQQSVQNLNLTLDMPIWAIFKTNTPILGVLP
jgi:molybdate transport system regulatory protein